MCKLSNDLYKKKNKKSSNYLFNNNKKYVWTLIIIDNSPREIICLMIEAKQKK